MKINWRGYEFKWIQGGLGMLTENIAGHVHSKNSYELHYIIGGKGELLTAEKSYNLSEEMFFITGPNVYHEQKTKKEDPLTEVHCYLQCSGRKTNDILGNIFFEHHFYIGQQKKFKRYFLNIAKELEQKNIGYETVKNLYSQYSSLNENKSAGEYDDSKIDSALNALKDNAAHEGGGKSIARSSPPRAYSAPSSVSKAKQTSESKAESTEGGNAIENPLVKVQKVKASGILSQVVDESTVSGNSIDTSARVSGRSLHKGTGGWSESGDDWYAKVLMQQYILTYMSCYTDTNPNHALNYEVEYIIGGRASDKDNLKIVIAEILALRAAANMAYLAGSASKQAQAMALAAIIGGITLTPEVIEGVEKGILAAWAFCESVLDLRALLDGDKIPLIKSDTSWTSSLYGMTSMLTGQVKAKSSNEGIGYKSYLGMLLFTKSMKNIAYRSMDVQEATVRMTGAHESFRMDNAICELSTDVSYKYHGIFLCFVNLLDGADNEYTIKNKAKYSYYGR